jgi:hypothetical protein
MRTRTHTHARTHAHTVHRKGRYVRKLHLIAANMQELVREHRCKLLHQFSQHRVSAVFGRNLQYQPVRGVNNREP